MTIRSFSMISKSVAISAVQLSCLLAGRPEGSRYVATLGAQERVNPQAQTWAQFTERVKAYLAVQKKVEGTLTAQKQTNDPERITAHVTSLANGIRAARTDAKVGDVFGDAAEQFRQAMRQDAKDRSARDKTATMKEVPTRTAPRINADYPETAALATVPPLVLTRLPRLPDGIEYRFMGRDLILRDSKANLIVDILPNAGPEGR